MRAPLRGQESECLIAATIIMDGQTPSTTSPSPTTQGAFDLSQVYVDDGSDASLPPYCHAHTDMELGSVGPQLQLRLNNGGNTGRCSPDKPCLCAIGFSASPALCTDDNVCLQSKPSWGDSYTCAGSTTYCTGSWAEDMHNCCPMSCGICPSDFQVVNIALPAALLCLLAFICCSPPSRRKRLMVYGAEVTNMSTGLANMIALFIFCTKESEEDEYDDQCRNNPLYIVSFVAALSTTLVSLFAIIFSRLGQWSRVVCCAGVGLVVNLLIWVLLYFPASAGFPIVANDRGEPVLANYFPVPVIIVLLLGSEIGLAGVLIYARQQPARAPTEGGTGGRARPQAVREIAGSQWVSRVLEASSQYDRRGWSKHNVAGVPRVYPRYGDIHGAWAAHAARGTQEWIELEFNEAVLVGGIEIYETYYPGAVTQVKLWNPVWQVWDSGWQGGSQRGQLPQRSRVFSPPITRMAYATRKVRLEVDQRAAGSWSQIDAVRLLRRDAPSTSQFAYEQGAPPQPMAQAWPRQPVAQAVAQVGTEPVATQPVSQGGATLTENVELLRSRLGLSGNVKSVLDQVSLAPRQLLAPSASPFSSLTDLLLSPPGSSALPSPPQAAEKLGVETAGKPLMEVARECVRASTALGPAPGATPWRVMGIPLLEEE